MSNFIEKCLLRESAPDDIDDFIDQWHENPGNQTLHEFLGMTRDEYESWVTDAVSLASIINVHRSQRNRVPLGPSGKSEA
jgi:hypothetical protein